MAFARPVLSHRQRLANQGIYPGVEYRILEVSVFPTITTTTTTTAAPSSSTDHDDYSGTTASGGSSSSSSSSSSGGNEPRTPSSSFSPSSPDQQRRQADLGAEPASLLSSAREAPEGSFEDGGLVFTMRPIYPLVGRLERADWPVRVAAREFPVMLTPFSYNAATAWAALTTSLSLLAVGFVLSQALTFSVINSHSMEPTLQVGV